tara:strand:+ start:285 stop:899 length:615 start_codon:yes stop_codon:yes gene_type:complete
MRIRAGIFVLTTSVAFMQAPLSNAETKVPSEVVSVIQKTEVFVTAYNQLEETCMPIPVPKDIEQLMTGAPSASPLSKARDKWNQLSQACQGSIVAGCIYDATKDTKAKEVLNKPLSYATTTAKCIINVNKEVQSAKDGVLKEMTKASQAAAREVERGGKEAIKKTEQATQKAANETKNAAKKAANEATNAGKKMKNLFKKKKKK